jgi:hypothetical protein
MRTLAAMLLTLLLAAPAVAEYQVGSKITPRSPATSNYSPYSPYRPADRPEQSVRRDYFRSRQHGVTGLSGDHVRHYYPSRHHLLLQGPETGIAFDTAHSRVYYYPAPPYPRGFYPAYRKYDSRIIYTDPQPVQDPSDPVARHLLRDQRGSCWERLLDTEGEERLVELAREQCTW